VYPARIEWTDVACFAGEHSLDLAPSVYAVTARHVDDAGRSNWLGKSTLLSLIPYALFGWHPKRTDDEWINDDASECCVKLTLSDGVIVERSRKRGQSTQIRFTAKGKKTLTQKSAQAAIIRHIGLTCDDYFATCHFEQKQLARLVTSRSGDRADIIDGWLQADIDPIQRMHDRALDALARLSDEHAKAEADAGRISADAKALLEKYGIDDGARPLPAMDAIVEQRQTAADNAKTEVDQWQAKSQKRAQWVSQSNDAARYASIVTEGKSLKSKVARKPKADTDATGSALARAKATHTEAKREFDRVKRLDCGDFDGLCPIMGADCPVASTVRESGPAPGVLDETQLRVLDCYNAHTAAEATHAEAKKTARFHMETEARLKSLRREARRLKPAADAIAKKGQPPIAAAVQAGLSESREAEVNARVALEEVRNDRDWLRSAATEVQTFRTERDRLASSIALHREAVALLGRDGAQKRVAMLALGQIEAGANALLTAAGVALSVRFVWAREGKGLAKVCGQCGTAFAASARVKECQRCGAQRGPHLIQKLDIELTNRSGAAEDLAGIAVQLSASNWLRVKRSTPWTGACIDEPFGALDATNKRALALHVSTMLRDRFDVALVVAHDRGILDALPSQVAIVADDEGSRLEGTHGTKRVG
jgi:DNA repair exonuclease SbcCD ATPase subunit